MTTQYDRRRRRECPGIHGYRRPVRPHGARYHRGRLTIPTTHNDLRCRCAWWDN